MRKLVMLLMLSACATTTLKAERAMAQGLATVSTYKAVAAGLDTDLLTGFTMSLEASATQGFKIAEICVSYSGGASAGVNVMVQRRTTASSGGTALVIEGTGNYAISKIDPTDPDFYGIGRVGGTLGTAGALLDHRGFQVGGTSTVGVLPTCIKYDQGKRPHIMPGTSNGVSITVIPDRANNGGRSVGGISVTLTAG